MDQPKPLARKENNFDVLRLLAAMLVIFSHSFGACGMQDPVLIFTKTLPGGQLAVNIFFVISGYLIMKSWLRKPELLHFFRNRVLRIYPGLIAVIILTIFIFGPLLTDLPLSGYFTNSNTYSYLINLSLWKLQFGLPGVSNLNGAVVVNAPLWTLFFEFVMYIIVAVSGITILKHQYGKWILIVIYFLFLSLLMSGIPADLMIMKISAKNFVTFFLYFFSGAFYYLLAEKKSPGNILLIIMLFLSLVWRNTFFFNIQMIFTTTATVFAVAFSKFNPLKFITSKADLSYGLYLYGFIIQNIIIHFTGINYYPVILFLIVLIFTSPFAYFSWKTIESPALRLK